MDGYSIRDAIKEHADKGDASCQKYISNKEKDQEITAKAPSLIESALDGIGARDKFEKSIEKDAEERAQRRARDKEFNEPESVKDTIRSVRSDIEARDKEIAEKEERAKIPRSKWSDLPTQEAAYNKHMSSIYERWAKDNPDAKKYRKDMAEIYKKEGHLLQRGDGLEDQLDELLCVARSRKEAKRK